MEPAASIEDFVAEPIGNYVSGGTYLVWCTSADLGGTAIWGRPDEGDARAIARLWDYDHRLSPGYGALTDVSRLEAASPLAFDVLLEYAKSRLPSYAKRMGRHAIVHAPGVMGSVVAGFYPLLGAEHRWQLFTSAPKALEWLGHAESQPMLLALVAQALGVPAELRRCREWIVANLAHATVDAAARSLAVSPRTLQRQLLQMNTSFQEEVEQVRAARIRVLLSETDTKIEVIAQEVGCTRSHLHRLCARIFGMTPAELRARARNPSS